MTQLTEEERLLRRIEQRFNKGTRLYHLLEDGDKILVGLSGGKDSLALLHLLAHRSRVLKPHFQVFAAHIALTNIPYQADETFLRRFAEERGVEFVRREASFDASTDRRKSPCFLCSWNRRKALFTLAQELGCNKIALGHHMDDILETLLMNLTFQGAFSTMPPKLEMKKFRMTIIRPLCLVCEDDLAQLASYKQFPRMTRNCPYEQDSHRADMKRVLHQLQALNPEARYSLWGSMSNIQTELLPEKTIEK